MRGGALANIAWALILAVSLVICWIWTRDTLQVGLFGFAVLVTLLGAAVAVRGGGRQALRKGAPTPSPEPDAVPSASAPAAAAGIGFAAILFGLAWASFLVFFGGGLLVVSLTMWAREARTERRARRRWYEEDAA